MTSFFERYAGEGQSWFQVQDAIEAYINKTGKEPEAIALGWRTYLDCVKWLSNYDSMMFLSTSNGDPYKFYERQLEVMLNARVYMQPDLEHGAAILAEGELMDQLTDLLYAFRGFAIGSIDLNMITPEELSTTYRHFVFPTFASELYRKVFPELRSWIADRGHEPRPEIIVLAGIGFFRLLSDRPQFFAPMKYVYKIHLDHRPEFYRSISLLPVKNRLNSAIRLYRDKEKSNG